MKLILQVNIQPTRLLQLPKLHKFGTLADWLVRDYIVVGSKDNEARAHMWLQSELELNQIVSTCHSNKCRSSYNNRNSRTCEQCTKMKAKPRKSITVWRRARNVCTLLKTQTKTQYRMAQVLVISKCFLQTFLCSAKSNKHLRGAVYPTNCARVVKSRGKEGFV